MVILLSCIKVVLYSFYNGYVFVGWFNALVISCLIIFICIVGVIVFSSLSLLVSSMLFIASNPFLQRLF